MKRKIILTLISICILLSIAILLVDYYRPIFVNDESSSQKLELEQVEKDVTPSYDVQTDSSIGFCIFGDNLIHENVLKFANKKTGGTGEKEEYTLGFNFKPLYQNVSNYINQADYAIINQSSLVGAYDGIKTLSGYPLFHSPKSLGNDLIELGIDAINMGNNHTLDMGEAGYYNSVKFWKTKEVDLIGGYSNLNEMNDYENKIHEISGIRVAMLSYTASTNGISASGQCPIPYFAVNQTAILSKKLTDDVKAVKEISDFVIVFMNWGNCAGYEPDDTQVNTAQILADAGADLIVGTGPKVIQKIDEISSSKTDHVAICAYSLGNSMGTMEYMENLLGGILTFNLTKSTSGCKIENVKFNPTVIHYNSDYSEIALYPLNEYSEVKYLEHGSNYVKGFGNFDWFYETVNKTIPKKYRP